MGLDISDEVKQLIQNNVASEDFNTIPGRFDKLESGNYGFIIEWEKVSKTFVQRAEENLALIDKRKQARQLLKTIQVGDYLERKDGSVSRITYHWGKSVQDGGGAGSFYLDSSGAASYSGSLDDPISLTKIVPTEEEREGRFWLFSCDWSGANRGIDFCINVKVWKEV